jgi:diacylglycerol kinase (ATP)
MLDEARRIFAAGGIEAELAETKGPGEATEIAQRATAERRQLVIACGGDGTLNGALNGVAGSETALAVVPLGTANVWAGEASLPEDPLAASRLVAEGTRHRLDTGSVAGHAFLLMASTGLDSLVAEQVDWKTKRRLGRAAYLARAALELPRYMGLRAEVTLDGVRIDTSMLGLIAGNTRSYGGILDIAREARADDGWLDVCLFEGSGRRRFAQHLVDLLRSRHTESRQVHYYRARRIELQTEKPWPVQADGEVVAHTPVTIECVPQSVTVVVAPDKTSPLWRPRAIAQ